MPSVQRDNTSWKKRILVPFWILRIFFLVVLIGFYALAMIALGAVTSRKEDLDLDLDTDSKEWKLGIGLAVFFMILLVLCLLLDIIAIVLFIRHNLKPRTMLIFNCIQTAIWIFLLILEIISVAKGSNSTGLIASLVILATFLILLVYSAVNCHRQRKHGKGGAYTPAHNPANPPSYGQATTPYSSSPEYHNGAYNPYTSNTTNTTYGGAPVELQNKPGAANSYYNPV